MPVSLLLVFLLLFAMFGNVKDGLLVFSGIPFALTGGILALWLRDIPLSISAGGLHRAVRCRRAQRPGDAGHPQLARGRNAAGWGAIHEGALTALAAGADDPMASYGFIPMAIATGTGGSATPAGYRSDRRHLVFHRADAAGATDSVSVAPSPDEQEEDVTAEPA